METSSEKLIAKIRDLDIVQTSDAVRNLRLSLQYHWNHTIDNREVIEQIAAVTNSYSSELTDAIIINNQESATFERWGKALLLFCAEHPALTTYVTEAVEDALESGVKDFGLSSMIVVGVVLVLLKYRPTKLEVSDKKVKAEWTENDVNIINDLVKAITPFASKKNDSHE